MYIIVYIYTYVQTLYIAVIEHPFPLWLGPQDYLAKSFYKTASLLAAACHAAALLSRPQSSPDAEECACGGTGNLQGNEEKT